MRGLCCVSGNGHPRTGTGAPSQGPRVLFLAAAHFGGREERGKAVGYPNTSHSPRLSLPSPPAMQHLPLPPRCCARGDRLRAAARSTIIIIILPRIRDERGDYGACEEALVSRGCRQRAARRFSPSALRGAAPSRRCSRLRSGPAVGRG